MDATVGTLGATEHGGSRLKGSALRHSVEGLVLDTVFVTFGIIILILIRSGVSRSRAGRAQPPHAIAARSCGAGTSSGGSTLGGWTSTKRCGDQNRGPVQIERLRT